ncbi:MAG: hypothetical protein ACNA8H_10000 [Anaerolineales bacterium]
MQTVFSHIIQKRYSQSYEDIATDALAYILGTHKSTYNQMIKILSDILPGLPDLDFQTQVGEGDIRPDMCWFHGPDTFVFIENKFWAGLTEHQPVSYLHKLANDTQPTLLLMIVPVAREHVMISQLTQRMQQADIHIIKQERKLKGLLWWVKTSIGPYLALTSWSRLLNSLETVAEDDPAAQRDLALLRSLCDSADIDRFMPLNSEELTNQNTPALLTQMGRIIRECVGIGVHEGFFSRKGLTEASTFNGFGRYIQLPDENGAGAWFGIDFSLWKAHGTPLWLKFASTQWGRAAEVESLLKEWSQGDYQLAKNQNGEFALSINLATGIEKDELIEQIIDQMREISKVLSDLPPIGNEGET